jgi:hypothetical protein
VVINIPIYSDPDKVEEIYSKKDDVEIKYVATTALDGGLIASDIYYRETPHPDFGNRYFRLTVIDGKFWIGDADKIEDLEFGMIQDLAGDWWYSTHRHDYIRHNECVIDGGRAYVRGNNITMFKMVNGEFIKQGE